MCKTTAKQAQRSIMILTRLCALLLISIPSLAMALEYTDPEGDDDGPGTYVYPTDRAYERGSFDIQTVEIEADGDTVEFRVEVAARIEDPWNSEDWGGNGFSLQFAQVYIDLTPGDQDGFTNALPGINAQFAEDQAWNRVVLISPQGETRLTQEVNEKAPDMAESVVIPESTRAQGRTLVASVPLSAFGDAPIDAWGIQVVMQSNEGYPTSTDILTRPVNEFEGPHRFGGGNDHNCDPHVIDLLAGSATGDAGEVEAQHQALGGYTCEADGTGTPATLTMIYR